MARSYLFVNDYNKDILQNNDIFKADVICFCIYLVKDLYLNNDNIFEELSDKGVRLSLILDTNNLKETFKILDAIKPIYFTSWVIADSSTRLLNKLSVKVRDYEQTHALAFGYIDFLCLIDNPKNVVNSKRIAKYFRTKALLLDYDAYRDYLGVSSKDNNYHSQYLREKIVLAGKLSSLEVIDFLSYENINTEDDLILGKNIGCNAKATYRLEEVEMINQLYTPTLEEVADAKLIIAAYLNSDKKRVQEIEVENRKLSHQLLINSLNIVNLDHRLNNRNTDVITYQVKGGKVKDVGSDVNNISKFYTLGEEIGNAITHGFGIVLSLVMIVLFSIKGAHLGDVKVLMSYLTFAVSSLILYSMSTLYHSLSLGSKAKSIFRRFDHMTIYLLIAGTYTPYSLLVIKGQVGFVLCIVLWLSALIGLLLNLFYFGKFRVFHMILYVVMGWVAVFFMPQIVVSLDRYGLVLLISGGVMYTLGIIFYGLKLFKFTHMVWHIFVLAGTILHFLSIYLYV